MFIKYYDYLVFEDGKIYSNKTDKYLKGEITKHGYIQYTLSINGKSVRIKAHRLVAVLFLEKPNDENKNVVNHKDGNKLNNHWTNLEWCTTYENNKHARIMKLNDIQKSNVERWKDDTFREKVSQKISKTKIEKGLSKGRNNNRFRYEIKKEDKEISRQELSNLLNRSLSNIDKKIRECANGERCLEFMQHNITVNDTKKSQQTIQMIA